MNAAAHAQYAGAALAETGVTIDTTISLKESLVEELKEKAIRNVIQK